MYLFRELHIEPSMCIVYKGLDYVDRKPFFKLYRFINHTLPLKYTSSNGNDCLEYMSRTSRPRKIGMCDMNFRELGKYGRGAKRMPNPISSSSKYRETYF